MLNEMLWMYFSLLGTLWVKFTLYVFVISTKQSEINIYFLLLDYQDVKHVELSVGMNILSSKQRFWGVTILNFLTLAILQKEKYNHIFNCSFLPGRQQANRCLHQHTCIWLKINSMCFIQNKNHHHDPFIRVSQMTQYKYFAEALEVSENLL